MKILKIIFFTLSAVAFFGSCSKEYSLEGGNITLAGGTWKFEQGSLPYNGNIDSSSIQGSGRTKTLTIVGKSLSGQENFSIILHATDSFTTGSYKASLSASQFKYSTTVKTIFLGDLLTGEFTVEISSLSNNSIVGTFSGQVQDSTGNQTQITLGSFVSTIDLSNNGTGQPGGGVSTGTLGGAGGACAPATLAGNFTQGVALAVSNTVEIQVNITSPGTYTIATNSVNGVNFFKTGVFTSTGVQKVILNGTGTPQTAGIQSFTITFGSSNCTFPVTFLPGAAPVGDYFPTTLNSSWVYGLQGSTTDSFAHKVINFTPTIAGQTFSTISEEFYPLTGTAQDSLYFRKSGGDYFQYEDVSLVFGFDDPVFGEINFLKDNVQAGVTWQSQNFSGTILGVPITGFMRFTILEKAVSATIGTLPFDDVIKVQAESFLSIAPGTPFLTVESWFARGVGSIYNSGSAAGISETYEIGQYQVF